MPLERFDRDSTELKPWEPKELSDRHLHAIALAASGMKNNAIAALLDMSESRVSVILNDPRSRQIRAQLSSDFVSKLMTDTREVIQGHALEAVHTVVDLMRNAESERVRQTSAFDILDRAGFKPVERSITAKVELPDGAAQTFREAVSELREHDEREIEMVEDSSGIFHRVNEEVSARK